MCWWGRFVDDNDDWIVGLDSPNVGTYPRCVRFHRQSETKGDGKCNRLIVGVCSFRIVVGEIACGDCCIDIPYKRSLRGRETKTSRLPLFGRSGTENLQCTVSYSMAAYLRTCFRRSIKEGSAAACCILQSICIRISSEALIPKAASKSIAVCVVIGLRQLRMSFNTL